MCLRSLLEKDIPSQKSQSEKGRAKGLHDSDRSGLGGHIMI